MSHQQAYEKINKMDFQYDMAEAEHKQFITGGEIQIA